MNTTGPKSNTATASSTTSDAATGNNSASVSVEVFGPVQISGLSYNAGAGTFSMSVPTVNGASYVVEFKNALTDPGWTPLPGGPVPGNGAAQIITDPGPLPPTRFYRIVVQY